MVALLYVGVESFDLVVEAVEALNNIVELAKAMVYVVNKGLTCLDESIVRLLRRV